MHHSFAVTYAHLSLESLLFPCFQAFFIFKFRHILLAFCIVLWCNKYYTKRSACYVPQKTPNLNGRIRLSIVDTYYDKAKKCSRQKSSYDDREHFFEKTDYSLDDVYRCLSFLDKHKENLQIWLNDHIKENYGRDTSLIYYDVTNYYFETDEQTDFLRKGVSKEHRPNPIVQMGLFMDNQGIPITYELFPGNTNDCLTYRPNFGRIKKQFDLGRVISVADKGMTTGDNIWYTINTPTHDGYVFSMSIRGAEKSIKDYVLEQEGYE